jgi:thiamine pyrophosphate-dependent acetolactate synthase large subunit-like protein
MNTILFIHEFKYDYNLPITERSFLTATKGVTFGAGVPAGVAADALSGAGTTKAAGDSLKKLH